jgi:hypothetical protein
MEMRHGMRRAWLYTELVVSGTLKHFASTLHHPGHHMRALAHTRHCNRSAGHGG